MAYPLSYHEEELIEKAWKLQLDNPALSEGAICGLMHCGREYIANRAKKSDAIKELRDRMAGVRQAAWEDAGLKLISSPAKETNPMIYIWMTRNILGWRNDSENSAAIGGPAVQEVIAEKVISPGEYLLEVKARREQREKESK